jgi:hypothetical protein
MIQKMIDAIKKALHTMDKKYCELSRLDYKRIDPEHFDPKDIEQLKRIKYLERPLAYEFYHQLRSLIDSGKVDFGGPIVQAEVDKDYQHMFKDGKIPDFIIHAPNATNKNLAILEFKLANREVNDLENDLDKLELFKKEPYLKYTYAVEILVGNKEELEHARDRLQSKLQSLTEDVEIISFDIDTWQASSA